MGKKEGQRYRERMEIEREEEVVIVGAGIAGLATAVALHRVGVRPLVLERWDGLRATGAALSLFPNAWLALEALGVAHKLISLYKPFTKVYITNVANGSIQEVSVAGTDGNGGVPRTVHRKALVEALAEELPPNTIRFSSKLASIEAPNHKGPSITILHLEDGTKIKAKVLIGCDGVHSVVSRWLGLSEPVYAGRSAVRGLAVLPKGHGLGQESQQFVDVGKRGGIIPLNENEFYWGIACKSTYQAAREDMVKSPESIQREVIEKYANNFPPTFLEVVRHSDLSVLTWAPLMLRYPWDVLFGNLRRGAITVAGDAMHPMTPDLGQGGCSALEDAVVLARHIGNSTRVHSGSNHMEINVDEVAKAIEGYVKERRLRVARLIAASYISGWAQGDGSGWLMKFVRDVFYRHFYGRMMSSLKYDCGKLPTNKAS